LILGSRALRENVPLRSQFGNTVTRTVFALFTGHPIHDTQTGLRAFHTSLIPALLQIEGDRYEYEMNVLLEFSRGRIPIVEVEISTIYLENNSRSHFNTLRDSFRVYKEIIKFSASSLICFGVDYGLYSLLTLATGSLTLANISARVVSASLNYYINRRHVFKSDHSVLKSGLQYAALAVAILAVNTLLLSLLVDHAGLNRYAAKLLTEAILFMASWFIQRYLIFHKRPAAAAGA
jgi:putative flippase GtrA